MQSHESKGGFQDFLLLPSELQQEVIRQCGKDELLALARTSEQLYKLTTPFIYHIINLACHNDEGLFDEETDIPTGPYRMVAGDDPYRQLGDAQASILQQQYKLAETLVQRPEYGLHVISLTWTFMGYDYDPEGAKYYHYVLKAWKAFVSMKRVRSVDICSFCFSDFHKNSVPTGLESLFSSATSVQVGGKIASGLLYSILSSPVALESLYLDNLHRDWPMRGDEFARVLELSNSATAEYHLMRYRGPMLGLLSAFENQYPNLRDLTIRMWGEERQSGSGNFQFDCQRYQEIASFLDKKRSSLRSFNFEQGEEPGYITIYNDRSIPRPRRKLPRPMDTRFMDFIYPVLMAGPWPQLEAVEICGLGGENRLVPDGYIDELTGKIENLRATLGKKVILIWTLDSTKTFHLHEMRR